MTIDINKQVSLRLLQREDAKVIFKTIDKQRDYLGEWLPFVAITKEQSHTEAFIKSMLQQPVAERELIFVIWCDEVFAGIIGFKETDRLNRKTEIGYWLSESFQKKGIVTASVHVLCKYAFEKLALNRVQIKCAVGNIPSQKVPERLGFTFEGVERAGERFSEKVYFDLNVYSLLKSDTVNP